MGVVKMKRDFVFMHKGYPYGTDVLYVYCDKCGSFSIKTYLGMRKLIFIVAFCFYTGIFIKNAFVDTYWMVYYFVSLYIGSYFVEGLWGDKNYKCRLCGYKDIKVNHPKDYASMIHEYNTLDYPGNLEIIDVPDNLTQKRYQGYWDDEYQ